MAQQLHTRYGFSYTQLKVLLGGWHAWQQAGYPAEQGAPVAGAPTPAIPPPPP